jgi:hypothetical protein
MSDFCALTSQNLHPKTPIINPGTKSINKLLNKLPLDDSLLVCRVLPQQGCDGAAGLGTWVGANPFPINTEWPGAFQS